MNGENKTTRPETVSVQVLQAIINELTVQRNIMSERAANLAVQLATLQQKLDEKSGPAET